MNIKNSDTVWHTATITRQHRQKQNNHKSIVLWFTGLPSSGKSTTAHMVEEKLHEIGCRTFVIDGDNVRHGLCSDLGFTKEDRTENIRRIGEVSKLLIEAGLIAITAFISPFRSDRQKVRDLLSQENFIEIYCRCPVEICEKRDPKGHYRSAREGKIKEFTGLSSPYEEPENPEVVIDTHLMSAGECSEKIINFLIDKAIVCCHNS